MEAPVGDVSATPLEISCFVCISMLPSRVGQHLAQRLQDVLGVGEPLEVLYLCADCNLKLLQIEQLITELQKIYREKGANAITKSREGVTVVTNPSPNESIKNEQLAPAILATMVKAPGDASENDEDNVTFGDMGDNEAVSPTNQQRLDCGCGATFTNQHSLEVHRRDNHGGGVACRDCGLTLTEAAEIMKHSSAHSTDSFKCLMCGQSFDQMAGLQEHQRLSKSCVVCLQGVSDDLKCGCGAEFANVGDLRIHRETVHAGRFVCEVCKKTYHSNSHLLRHYQQMHARTTDKKPVPQRKSIRERKVSAAARRVADEKKTSDTQEKSLTARQRAVRKVREAALAGGRLDEHVDAYDEETEDDGPKPAEVTRQSLNARPVECSSKRLSEISIQPQVRKDGDTPELTQIEDTVARVAMRKKTSVVMGCLHPEKKGWGWSLVGEYDCSEKAGDATVDAQLKQDCGMEGTPSADYQCTVCDVVYQKERFLQKHIEKHHWEITDDGTYSCSFARCCDNFHGWEEMMTHARMHRSEMSCCPLCGKAFAESWQLSEHNTHTHKDAMKLYRHPCPVCDIVYQKPSRLHMHITKHHWEVTHDNKYKCAFSGCSQVFDHQAAVSSHALEHRAEMSHCLHCEKIFPEYWQLWEHHRIAHKDKNVGNKSSVRLKPPEFPCPTCDIVYMRPTFLQQHIERHHWSPSAGKYRCTFMGCGLVFDGQGDAATHARTHRTQMSACQQCRRVFPDSARLCEHTSMHKKGVAVGDMPTSHACPKCARVFIYLSDLAHHSIVDHAQHLVMTPHKPRLLSCPHCHLSFSKQRALNKHLRGHATGLGTPERIAARANKGMKLKKKHLCSVCGAAYVKHSSYLIHLASHEQQPLSCPHCSKHFAGSVRLKQHMEQHTRPYLCPECGKRCGSMPHLKVAVLDVLIEHRMSTTKTSSSDTHSPLQELTETKRLKLENGNACPVPGNVNNAGASDEQNEDAVTELVHHPCPTCDLVYRSAKYLTNHIAKYHWDLVSNGEYRCSYSECGRLCQGQGEMAVHARTHRTQMWMCELCEAVFPHRNRLTEHKLHEHIVSEDGTSVQHHRPTSRVCVTCGQSFNTKSELSHHCLVTHKTALVLGCAKYNMLHVCPHCCQTFNAMQDLHKHLSCHTNKLTRSKDKTAVQAYKCLTCHRNFHTKTKHAKHVRTCTGVPAKKEKRHHLCNICGATYVDKGSFQLHLANHSDTGQFQCEHCPKRFVRHYQLQVHLAQHTKPYMCAQCGVCFSTLAHMQVSSSGTSVVYLCPVCDHESSTEYQRRNHIVLHHWKMCSEKEYCCAACETSCGSVMRMVDHARGHRSAMWQCAECAYVVPHGERLAQEHHMLEEHRFPRVNPMRMHTCKVCLLMFPTRPALGYHRIHEHPGPTVDMPVDTLNLDDRKVQCNYCELVFPDRAARRAHIIPRHGDQEVKGTQPTRTPGKAMGKARVTKPVMKLFTPPGVKVLKTTPGKGRALTRAKHKNMEVHDSLLRQLLGSDPQRNISWDLGTQHQTRYFCPNCDAVYHMAVQYAEHIMRCHWRPLLEMDGEFTCVICEARHEDITAVITHACKAHHSAMWLCGDCPVILPKTETAQRNRHRHLEHQGPRIAPPTMLNCELCVTKEATRRELCYHYIVVHGEFRLTEQLTGDDIYRCSHCPASFRTHRKLIIHTSKQHPRHRPRHISSKTDGHRTGKEQTEAPFCEETEVGAVESGTEYAELAWMEMCPVCDAHYYMRKPFDRHLADVHWTSPAPGMYRCVECGDGGMFETLLEIVTHTRTCQQESLWRCAYCPAAFPREELWQRCKHRMLEHRRERCREADEYECRHCEEKYVQTSELSYHQMEAHEDMSMRLEEVSHFCNYCGKEFFKERALVNHTKKHGEASTAEHHSKVWVRPSIEKRRIVHKRRIRPPPKMTPEIKKRRGNVRIGISADGERMVEDLPPLVVNMDRFEQTDVGYRCKHCLKVLRTHAGAAKHDCSTWVPNAKRDFLCSICGRVFKQRFGYDRHMSIAHVKNGCFPCETCGRNFTTRRVLTMHMLSHSKPYLCVYCGKAFSQQAHLKEHQAKHTGDQRFACDICSKTFTWRMSLRRHRYSTHKLGVDPERWDNNQRAKCSLCAKIVSVKARAKHFKQRHKDVVYTTSRFVRISKPVPGELTPNDEEWVPDDPAVKVGDVSVRVPVDSVGPHVDLNHMQGNAVGSAVNVAGVSHSVRPDGWAEVPDVGMLPHGPVGLATREEVVETQTSVLHLDSDGVLMTANHAGGQQVVLDNEMTFIIQHQHQLQHLQQVKQVQQLQQVQHLQQVVPSQPRLMLHNLQVNPLQPAAQPTQYHLKY